MGTLATCQVRFGPACTTRPTDQGQFYELLHIVLVVSCHIVVLVNASSSARCASRTASGVLSCNQGHDNHDLHPPTPPTRHLNKCSQIYQLDCNRFFKILEMIFSQRFQQVCVQIFEQVWGWSVIVASCKHGYRESASSSGLQGNAPIGR